MSLFLLAFNYFVDMNLFLGIIEILLAIGIYFATMWLIKGIDEEDFNLMKLFINKIKSLNFRKRSKNI